MENTNYLFLEILYKKLKKELQKKITIFELIVLSLKICQSNYYFLFFYNHHKHLIYQTILLQKLKTKRKGLRIVFNIRPYLEKQFNVSF